VVTDLKYLNKQVTEREWCRALYAGYKIDDADLTDGFLQSEMMVNMGLMFAYGPGIIKKEVITAADRAGRPKAHVNKFGVTQITLEFVAYTAMLTHFALSPTKELNTVAESNPTDPAKKAGFAYQDFYENILDALAEWSEEERAVLVDWWQKKIFGDPEHDAAEREALRAERQRARGVSDDVVEMREQRAARQP